MFRIQDIYNLKTKMRRQFFESLISIQALLQALNKDDWSFEYKTDVNQNLTHLFIIRNSFQELWLKNHEILVINFIYNINRYKMPLLIISDQTVLNINFYVGFCFMRQKKVFDYMWTLRQVFSMYKFHNLPDSTMIVINMKADM